jgi:hypothetical protein
MTAGSTGYCNTAFARNSRESVREDIVAPRQLIPAGKISQMTESLGAALASLSKRRSFSYADRAHLNRWANDNYPDNPIWERFAAAACDRNMLPMDSLHEGLIEECLYMRRRAEGVASGIDLDFRENLRQHQRLLELAKKADEIADYYKWAKDYSGIAMFFSRFFRPVEELQELHRREAQLFRLRANRTPKTGVRVSRQDRSKGRKGLRKINAFIHLANEYLRFGFFEAPDYNAIALLTEIAFPDFDIDPEYVRKALRPTTRAARKTASRALAPEKS